MRDSLDTPPASRDRKGAACDYDYDYDYEKRGGRISDAHLNRRRQILSCEAAVNGAICREREFALPCKAKQSSQTHTLGDTEDGILKRADAAECVASFSELRISPATDAATSASDFAFSSPPIMGWGRSLSLPWCISRSIFPRAWRDETRRIKPTRASAKKFCKSNNNVVTCRTPSSAKSRKILGATSLIARAADCNGLAVGCRFTDSTVGTAST